MKRFLLALLATAALASQADAAVKMCLSERSDGVAGPRQLTTNTSPSSTYNLDAFGCAMILPNDVGAMSAFGMSTFPSGGQVSVGPINAGTTTTPTVVLPPRSFITDIVVINTGVTDVSGGGIKIGTTSGGSDVVFLMSASNSRTNYASVYSGTGGALNATNSATNPSGTTTLNNRAFINQQTLFIDTPGAWFNSGVSGTTVTIFYQQY